MGHLQCPVKSCPLYKKYGCKPLTEQVKIHKFPKKTKTRARWEEFVSQQNGTLYTWKRNDGLCTSHFGVSFIMPSGRITRDAVPSISTVSTKKLLCKWDASTSKIVQIEGAEEGTQEEIGNTEVLRELITEHQEKTARSRLGKEEKDKQKLFDKLQEESRQNSGLEAMCCEDLGDSDSIFGDVSVMQEVVSSVPNASSSGHILPPQSLNALETESSFIPERPKSLDTIANVEQAITREKRLTLLRYQAGIRRIKGLEVLLRQLRDAGTASSDSSSPSKIVSSEPLYLVSSSSPTKLVSPLISILKPRPPSTSTPLPIHEHKTVCDIDLPPPLFDDYN